MSNATHKHPPAFYVIFMLEIWERFGYASVVSILAVFFVKQLGLSQQSAFVLFGAYSALLYAFIALGGYIGDYILGAKRTIILGLLILLSGYILLGFGNLDTVYFGMGLLCVGTGLFKSNPSSLLSKAYLKASPEVIHNAFTWFYMAINIGGVFGMFLAPILSSSYGYQYTFLASAIGIVLALATFVFSSNILQHIATPAGKRPFSLKKLILILIGTLLLSYIVSHLLQHIFYAELILWSMLFLIISYYLFLTSQQPLAIRKRMFLALILMGEAVLFQILYGQMQTSINFFTISNVTHTILGLDVDPQSFQSLNPFWIIILSPLLSYFYLYIRNKGIHFSIYNKFATGMLFCASAFLILSVAKYFADSLSYVSSWWVVISYLLQSTGELLISALGVAMVAELVPSAISGFVMGMWFAFLAAGNLLSGYVASFFAIAENTQAHESLLTYSHSFFIIGILALAVAVLMFAMSRFKVQLLPPTITDTKTQ